MVFTYNYLTGLANFGMFVEKLCKTCQEVAGMNFIFINKIY